MDAGKTKPSSVVKTLTFSRNLKSLLPKELLIDDLLNFLVISPHYYVAFLRGIICCTQFVCPSVRLSVRPSRASDFLEIGKL